MRISCARQRKRRENRGQGAAAAESGGGWCRRGYNSKMSQRVTCDLCDRVVPPGAHYVVKIEVFADPSAPSISTEDLEEADFDQTFAELIEEMKHLSADDLQDDVHRSFEYRICRPCQRKFLANPLGKPRENRAGE